LNRIVANTEATKLQVGYIMFFTDRNIMQSPSSVRLSVRFHSISFEPTDL